MNYKHLNDAPRESMAAQVAAEFARGLELIEDLDDSIYTKTTNGVGSVGAHFRHNLDFADNFLKGVADKRIDYTRRLRDLRVEQNRQYAKERFAFLIQSLKDLPDEISGREILVRSEIDEDTWHRSSVARELEFLHSHTVHHYALIAEKLRFFGVKVSPGFGVAPSTLKFWAEQKKISKVA